MKQMTFYRNDLPDGLRGCTTAYFPNMNDGMPDDRNFILDNREGHYFSCPDMKTDNMNWVLVMGGTSFSFRHLEDAKDAMRRKMNALADNTDQKLL